MSDEIGLSVYVLKSGLEVGFFHRHVLPDEIVFEARQELQKIVEVDSEDVRELRTVGYIYL